MQVRHHVAQCGQVDLGGLQVVTQGLLHHGHHIHAMLAAGGFQVGKLGHMGIPDHAVKRRKPDFIRADDTQVGTTPHQRTAVSGAKRASSRTHTSTRSIPPWFAAATYSGSHWSPRIWFAISTTM